MVDNDETMSSQPLTARQTLFCAFYASYGTPTEENAAKAAEQAGYCPMGIASACDRLVKMPKIQKRIAELQADHLAAAGITTNSTLRQLVDLYELAVGKKDYAVAAKCVELRMKYLKLLSEKFEIETVEKVRELSEKDITEAKRIAKVLLESPEVPTIKLRSNIA